MDILPHTVLCLRTNHICTDCWQHVSHILLPLLSLFVQHEKYTSQLQLSIKALQAKAKEKQLQSSDKSKVSISKLQDRAERRAQSLTGKHLCQHTLHHSKY